MKKPAVDRKFTSEAELCEAFLSVVKRDNVQRSHHGKWTAYAETGGFDILLVRDDGLQIGIEAKLALNVDVIRQALPDSHHWALMSEGPDHRAVLVPGYAVKPAGLGFICNHFGLTVLTVSWADSPYYGPGPSHFRASPHLPYSGDRTSHEWMHWFPAKRCQLPDYVPDVAAGKSGPVKLTFWKVAAIKLLILAKRRPVTRADFKHLQLDPRRWIDRRTGWLQPVDGGWEIGSYTPTLWLQHPANWAEIEADIERWQPRPPATLT